MQMFVKLPTRRRSVCISSLRSPPLGPRCALDSLQRALMLRRSVADRPRAISLPPRYSCAGAFASVAGVRPAALATELCGGRQRPAHFHLRPEEPPYMGVRPASLARPPRACSAPRGRRLVAAMSRQVFATCKVLVPGLHTGRPEN